MIGDNHKGETLYRWVTTSGVVWKGFGDKDTNPKYKGEVKREYIIFGDYIREGVGSLTYSDGDKYEGEWKDEKPWNGTYYDKDGNIKGKFVNGKEIHQ